MLKVRANRVGWPLILFAQNLDFPDQIWSKILTFDATKVIFSSLQKYMDFPEQVDTLATFTFENNLSHDVRNQNLDGPKMTENQNFKNRPIQLLYHPII